MRIRYNLIHDNAKEKTVFEEMIDEPLKKHMCYLGSIEIDQHKI